MRLTAVWLKPVAAAIERANVADATGGLERVDLWPKSPRRPRVMYETQVCGDVPPGGVGDLVAVVRFGAVDRREYLCV
jgi:hypothetical protein